MAQSFTDRTDLLSTNTNSGAAIGVVDMNGDGKDDIVRLNNASDLRIEYQGNPNAAFSTFNYGDLGGGSEWSLCVGDFDNNGFNDFLAGGAYNEIKILRANATGTGYQQFLLPGGTIFLQGSNFVDINNDGLLDIFACHDDDDNTKYRNTGNGTFVLDNSLIDTAMPSGNSGNYASIWTDFDNDGDLDMYLSKCRGGVSDPADPRRINRMLRNDGNNQFADAGAATGLNIGAQTWATDFADIDNDGDLDCFVMNHFSPSSLWESTGTGKFNEITSTAGFTTDDLNFFGIQCSFRDFDNDGFVDLLVSGDKHRLFRNNGDRTFTRISNPFNTDDIESFAIGDLNSDGYLDVFAGYANLFNSPSSIDDDLFMNNGGSNHWFTVELRGTDSNINGIGARLELYGSWGMQIREVRAGETYGTMNSTRQHFGIGTATSIDKLIVRWPSGMVDEWRNPPIDQNTSLVEGSTIPEVTLADARKLLTGQVLGGTVGDLAESDDMDFVLSPGKTSNLNKQLVDLVLLGETTVGQPVEMSVLVESSMAGGPAGDVTQRVQLWNDVDKRWDDIDTQVVQNEDTVIESFVLDDPSPYVDTKTNEILGRIRWASPVFSGKAYSWQIHIDRIVWLLR